MTERLVDLTMKIVADFVSNNECHSHELPDLIRTVGQSLKEISQEGDVDCEIKIELSPEIKHRSTEDTHVVEMRDGMPFVVFESKDPKLRPAVPIEESISDDWITCLEDGRKMKVLKRHLEGKYNMTVDEYRRKWGLPFDYPVIAPGYARLRKGIATAQHSGDPIPTLKTFEVSE